MKPEAERAVAEERGRQGDVCVPAEAMLTESLNGEEGSNLPGLLAGEAPSVWLMLLCCCWRKSRNSVTVTPPPPPLPEPAAGGLGAIGTGLVGVLDPLPLAGGRSLMAEDGGFLELPAEKS